jgi:predicted ATPase
MLTGLSVSNFKCFSALNLPLAPLTLLTGFNAGGKSTSLQALLLLSQTLRSQEKSTALRLNGPLLQLGSPADVINQRSGGSEMRLGIETIRVALDWLFRSEERRDRRYLRVAEIRIRETAAEEECIADPADLDCLLPPNHNASNAQQAVQDLANSIFVSAMRQVDSEVFPIPDVPRPVHGDVGSLGEYAPWWFHQEDALEIEPRRRIALKQSGHTFRQQLNAWASELFQGAEANAQPVPRTSLMRLELRKGLTEDWRRPSNIGYGLSYAFPILVAGLCAKGGQLLIIDSPEAHLHPFGQSRMGRFLTQIASAGVQVLVETHSDHIINGMRLSVREHVIPPDQVAIHFFEPPPPNSTGAPARVVRISVDHLGNLSHWPEGFFDQAERDLAGLAGWS